MKTKQILLLLGAGLILASCTKYPPSSDRLLEDLAIYTKYDVSVDFTKFNTYYLSDSIVKVSDDDSGWYYNSTVQSLTSRIALNMNNLGYVRTNNSQSADLFLGVSYVINVDISVYYPGWYWGYYPYNYWYDYGYYYPYYPAYITSYSVGTLLIDMMDVKHPTVDNKVPVRWNAYIRGLLTGDHTVTQVEQSIDQAFEQTKGFPGH